MRAGNDVVQVVGAGPAGLSAAVTLARAGRRVLVHEAQHEVGHRFGADLQGLENWSTEGDVLQELEEAGITTAFEKSAFARVTAFDAWDAAHEVRGARPIFYLVERGPGPGTLDSALLEQARALGVEVRFGSRARRLDGPGIFAVGPKAADAIAVGYHFETDMPDGAWIVLDDDVAPKGYAYLLVMGGRGTVKSCMFSGFRQERLYVERTLERFWRLVGLEMRNPRFHGGAGNFFVPVTAVSGAHPVAGEQAGFQDALAGFGMRYAIRSGIMAARALLGAGHYDSAWRPAFKLAIETSVVNRAVYARLGNGGYRRLLRIQAWTGDARSFLRWLYRPAVMRRALLSWARRGYHSRREDRSREHVDCTCVWCRGGGAGESRNAP